MVDISLMQFLSIALLILHVASFAWAFRILRRIGFGRRQIWIFLIAGASILVRDGWVIAMLARENPSPTALDWFGVRMASLITTLLMVAMLWGYASRLGALEKREPSTIGEMRALNGRFFREGKESVARIDEKTSRLRESLSDGIKT
jgi:hypothetical protein